MRAFDMETSAQVSLRGHLQALIETEVVEIGTWSDRECSEGLNSWGSIRIPKHTILVMVVGTRGDVDPLISLAVQLKEEGNHDIHFATHMAYKENVISAGLTFLPLAGDPEVLSEFAVKWSSSNTTLQESFEILQTHTEGVRELVLSSWTAIRDSGIIPDVVISNPVTFTHAHIAESCGSSLHIAFPQPWVPTTSFPHPLFAGDYPSIAAGLYDEGKKNMLSHQIADRMLYHGTESNINELRTTKLNLKAASIGEGHWKVIPAKKVPFSILLSSSLLLRPSDWGDHVKICGSVGQRSANPDVTINGKLPLSLESFLSRGSSPIYVGFGSMVFDGDSLEGLISHLLEAAAIHNVRIVVQLQSWSVISDSTFRHLASRARKGAQLIIDADQNELWFDWVVQQAMLSILSTTSSREGPRNEVLPSCPILGGSTTDFWAEDESALLLVGSVDHLKLFDRVIALVHHGGAGTTFQGLRCGLPTWVLPFFGDQRMWGAAIYERGAGPAPVAPQDVTLSLAADSFSVLLSDTCREAALSVKHSLRDENGAHEAASHVKESLPLHISLCTLSLLVDEVNLAECHCEHCDLNMTLEAFERSHESDPELAWHSPSPVTFADWSPQNPKTLAKGLKVGVTGLLRCLAGGVYDSLASPAQGAMDGGIYGALQGIVKGCSSLIGSTHEGGALLASKVHMGVTSGHNQLLRFCFPGSGGEGAQMKFRRTMSQHCCEEQLAGRLYDSYDNTEERLAESDLEARTLKLKMAFNVARVLQSFMISVRQRSYMTLTDPIFTFCLHSGELLAEVESLHKISEVYSVGWSDIGDQSDCWSPLLASSSSADHAESSLASSDFFVPTHSQSSNSLPTISDDGPLLSFSRCKDRVYLNDLALFVTTEGAPRLATESSL
jgi:UDP:flavonoid glycosyltransferase YjiC (YdhE family)